MSGTSAEFTLTLPISEQAFWTIALLFGLVMLSALIAWGLPKSKGGGLSPIDTICERLGLSHSFGPLVLLAVCVAMALGAAGLFTLVDFMKAALHMPPYHQVNDGAAIRNIGLVLAALLGAPFVIWRSYVAAKQARIQDEALFNDKINAAAADLSARRQVTRVVHRGTKDEVVLIEQENDLVTRAAAIARLEGLANEKPEKSSQIARQLSVFVRERSRETLSQELPESETIWFSAEFVGKPRSDIECAVQSLGRLQAIEKNTISPADMSLRQADLRGFDLSELCLQNVNFFGAQMAGVNLCCANLEGAQLTCANLQNSELTGAVLDRAFLDDAELMHADMSESSLRYAILSSANLAEATLFHANLEGAKLKRTNLDRAALFWVSVDQQTHFDEVSIKGTAFRFCDFSELKFGKLYFDTAYADISFKLPPSVMRPAHWLGHIEDRSFYESWQPWKAS